MDMSWQALLQEAAATSFEKTADTLAAAENDNCACIVAAPSGARPAVEQILFPLIPGGDRNVFPSGKCQGALSLLQRTAIFKYGR